MRKLLFVIMLASVAATASAARQFIVRECAK